MTNALGFFGSKAYDASPKSKVQNGKTQKEFDSNPVVTKRVENCGPGEKKCYKIVLTVRGRDRFQRVSGPIFDEIEEIEEDVM